jgi:hypothetical protein
MFVCLSSGDRPRYRRDIIRVAAMPSGTWIQFRYAATWIAPSIASQLDERKKRKRLRGTQSLIAYIDQADPGKDPEIVPCRYATLVDVAKLGRTTSLRLEFGDFAYAADLPQLNESLSSRVSEALPRRVDGRMEGCYWLALEGGLAEVTRSSNLDTWEMIVEQLASRSDFQQERFFYTLEGLVDVATEKRLRPKGNLCALRPSREYDLEIYHYHPTEGDPDTFLSATTSEPSISFAMTPEVLLDSRYDLKRIRLRTASPMSAERGVLTLRRRRRSENDSEWQFDLPVRLRGAVLRRLGVGLLIGVLLAVSSVVAAYSNPKLSDADQLTIALVGGGASLLAGVAAAFGLRRSL